MSELSCEKCKYNNTSNLFMPCKQCIEDGWDSLELSQWEHDKMCNIMLEDKKLIQSIHYCETKIRLFNIDIEFSNKQLLECETDSTSFNYWASDKEWCKKCLEELEKRLKLLKERL